MLHLYIDFVIFDSKIECTKLLRTQTLFIKTSEDTSIIMTGSL